MEQKVLLQIIGQNVFRYRKEAGLTQEQLSERTGLTPGTISKIERGTMAVMIITLYSIAQALHVTCDALLYPQTPSASIRSIELLLADQPTEFVAAIEHIIRCCVENFEHKPHVGAKSDIMLKSQEIS